MANETLYNTTNNGSRLFDLGTTETTNQTSIATILIVTFQILIMIGILFGNTLVIAAVFRFRTLRDPTGIFVANLAVADLVLGLSVPFHIAFYFNPAMDRNKHACLLRHATVSFSVNASLYSLLCVVIDRYLDIVYPLHYSQYMTRKRTYGLLVCIWTSASFLFLVPLLGINNWAASPVCLYELIMDKTFRFVDTLQAVAISVLMGLIYIRIYIVSRGHAVRMQEQSYQSAESVYRRQLTKVIRIILIGFQISWLPFLAVQLSMHDYDDVTETKVTASNFLSLLGISNSVFNPVIYAWYNEYFRAAFRKMFRLYDRNAVHPLTLY